MFPSLKLLYPSVSQVSIWIHMAYGLFVLIRLEVEDVECAPSRRMRCFVRPCPGTDGVATSHNCWFPVFSYGPSWHLQRKNIMAQQKEGSNEPARLVCFGLFWYQTIQCWERNHFELQWLFKRENRRRFGPILPKATCSLRSGDGNILLMMSMSHMSMMIMVMMMMMIMIMMIMMMMMMRMTRGIKRPCMQFVSSTNDGVLLVCVCDFICSLRMEKWYQILP